MAEERRRPDSVLLPTGDILIMGGENDETPSICIPQFPSSYHHIPSMTCEMLVDSTTIVLKDMAPLLRPRMYHSQAMLLPDGRVWMSGNLGEGAGAGTPAGNSYEIFYPPYLFSGQSMRHGPPSRRLPRPRKSTTGTHSRGDGCLRRGH